MIRNIPIAPLKGRITYRELLKTPCNSVVKLVLNMKSQIEYQISHIIFYTHRFLFVLTFFSNQSIEVSPDCKSALAYILTMARICNP